MSDIDVRMLKKKHFSSMFSSYFSIHIELYIACTRMFATGSEARTHY
jgi:hypothetical protein